MTSINHTSQFILLGRSFKRCCFFFIWGVDGHPEKYYFRKYVLAFGEPLLYKNHHLVGHIFLFCFYLTALSCSSIRVHLWLAALRSCHIAQRQMRVFGFPRTHMKIFGQKYWTRLILKIVGPDSFRTLSSTLNTPLNHILPLNTCTNHVQF